MIRKINPKIIPQDICQRSMDWLENYADKWFKENVPGHGDIWFADENSRGLGSFPKNDRIVEIVLTGSFFLKMLESKLWQYDQFRLWTFSTRVKNLISELYHIPAGKIGVIGRPPKTALEKPNFNHEINLVYAGRLSLAKNISAIIRLTSMLQSDYGLKVTLDLFGEPDDLPDESRGRYNQFPLEALFHDLINELPWSNEPIFHGNVPQGQWLNIDRPRPHFISLSSSMYEDFGTAAEMASQKAWPCVLSDWGGHTDTGNSILVPDFLVAQTHEPIFIQKFKTKALAVELLKGSLPFTRHDHAYSFIPIGAFQKNIFQEAIDQFIQKWGPGLFLCFREKMSYFADTAKGIEVFGHYHEAFGTSRNANAMIINDLIVNPEYNLVWEEKPFDIIYVREMFNPFFFKKFEHYKSITIVDPGTELPALIHYLNTTLGFAAPLHILTPSSSNFNHHQLLASKDVVREISIE